MPTWDLTDQDCDALDGGWSSSVVGSGTVSVVTEEGRSCYKLVNPGNAGDEARVTNTNVPWTTALTYEVVFKINDLANAGTTGLDTEFYAVNNSDMMVSSWRGINSSYYTYPVGYVTDIGEAHYAIGWIDISTSWHTFRMVVSNGYATLWYDGYLFCANVGPMVSPSYSIAKWMGVYVPIGAAHVGSSRIVYIDHIRASSTAEAPTVVAPINIEGQDIVSRIAQRTLTNWIVPSPVRFKKTNCKYATELVYEIPLVATTDTNASKVRIYDGSTVKALMKLPTF
jgi:hypothetical protein